jgi:Succinate dehydrogenase/fumarate reductase, flavoprotein subunit
MPSGTDGFDMTVDFLVAGSGAGGLTAALAANARGLRTLVVEKAAKFGGTSALSGGGMWVPNAPAQRRAGVAMDLEAVAGYLRTITKGIVSEERIRAFLYTAPEMMEFLEKLSPHIRFVFKPNHPDYYPELPGASKMGSLINVEPIDLRRLGPDEDLLLPPLAIAPRGVWIGPNELPHFYRFRQTWRGRAMFIKLVWRMVRARLTGERISVGGQALMARLMLAFRDAKIDLWLESPIVELLTNDAGDVIGAVIERQGRKVRVAATRGVLIATGGFERNQAMRDQYQPEGRADLTLGNPNNTGDGIRIAESVGADLRTMDSAWWYPAVAWAPGRIQFSLNERMLPSQLIVNGAGKRYINEPTPYSDFGFAMIEGQRTGVSHIPSWLIMDDWCWRRYVVFGHLPLPKIPFSPAPTGRKLPAFWRESGSVVMADTIPELAKKIGVPADALVATVERFNRMAAAGVDEDFHRGESAYDQTHADITLPHPNLVPLRKPPYYAFKLILSDLGTNGGIATDEHARALRPDGSVIKGLFATGNVSSAVMGRSYAGAGATISPAMTFGYIAATYAADHPVLNPDATTVGHHD